MTRTDFPRRARKSAAARPTGPAPAIIGGVSVGRKGIPAAEQAPFLKTCGAIRQTFDDLLRPTLRSFPRSRLAQALRLRPHRGLHYAPRRALGACRHRALRLPAGSARAETAPAGPVFSSRRRR